MWIGEDGSEDGSSGSTSSRGARARAVACLVLARPSVQGAYLCDRCVRQDGTAEGEAARLKRCGPS